MTIDLDSPEFKSLSLDAQAIIAATNNKIQNLELLVKKLEKSIEQQSIKLDNLHRTVAEDRELFNVAFCDVL
jgi:multidrug resistance efflux pump